MKREEAMLAHSESNCTSGGVASGQSKGLSVTLLQLIYLIHICTYLVLVNEQGSMRIITSVMNRLVAICLAFNYHINLSPLSLSGVSHIV